MSEINICYFIGRLNPPHRGHIKSLLRAISATEGTSKALILLGSGGKKAGTLDNPIKFYLKKRVIEYILKNNSSYVIDIDYVIEEMKNPTNQINQHIENILTRAESLTLQKINIIHIAGDKDSDKTKLDSLKVPIVKYIEKQYPELEITISTQGVSPAKSEDTSILSDLSATRVRQDAYSAYVANEDNRFLEKYESFYGRFTKEMYDQIVAPARPLSIDDVHNYIETGNLPTPTSTSKSYTKKRGIIPPSEGDVVSDSSKRAKPMTELPSMNRVTRRTPK
jgi:nicotinamide mononucleotide adenylyltransferase